MIQVSLESLFSAYVAAGLVLIAFAWLRSRLRVRKAERREIQNQIQCSLCAMIFEDRSSTLLPRCPRCGSLNERVHLRNL